MMFDSSFYSVRKSELHSRTQKGVIVSILLYMSTALLEVYALDGIVTDRYSPLLISSVTCLCLAGLGLMTKLKAMKQYIDIIVVLGAAVFSMQHALYFDNGLEDANYHFVFSQILATFAVILLCSTIWASLSVIAVMLLLPLLIAYLLPGPAEHILDPVSLYFLAMGEAVAVFYAVVIAADGRSRDQAQFELEQRSRENFDLANRDPLANCYNRRYFDVYYDQEFFESLSANRNLSLIIIDIDDFKSINDRYGHPVGDYVIKGVVECCAKTIRPSDTVARIGGEEFIIVLPKTSEQEALKLAQGIRESVEHSGIKLANGDSLNFSISLGVASLSSSDSSMETLLHRADKALYQSKENGKNCVTVGSVA
ncbi:MAG: GGDEF domain-containing protein [Cellvibrionaceae bacterium]|nr:GGDEF domain-containing protein [Cellvibrionaceae bacterium]